MFWLLATFWKQEKNCYNVAAWCKVACATYSIQSFFSYNPSKTIKDWRILLALKSTMENVCLYIRYHVQNWTISDVFSDFRHFRVAEPYHIVFTPEEIWCRSINFSNMQEGNKNKSDKLEQQKDFKNGTNLDYSGTISYYHTSSSFLSKVHELKATSWLTSAVTYC